MMMTSTACDVADDGWTTVTLSKNRRANRRIVRTSTASLAVMSGKGVHDDRNIMMTNKEVEYWIRRVEECILDIKCSDLWSNIMNTITIIESIECYGIGSIHNSIPSLYQFALVVALKRELGIEEVTISDPCMDDGDNRISHAFGFTTTTPSSSSSSHRCSSSTMQLLLFMPHCDRSLYVSILCQHDDVLSNVILIGNSFASYLLAKPDGYTKLEGLVDEIPIISTTSPCVSAFNDLSIITFPKHNIDTILHQALYSNTASSSP